MSLPSQAFQAIMRATVKQPNLTPAQTVRHVRRSFNQVMVPRVIPRGVQVNRFRAHPFMGDHLSVRGTPQCTVLYIHGGAYIAGVTRTYHNFTSRLAKALQGEAYLPVYPYAPEHPYPAAVNHCLAMYEYLLAQGKSPERIIIAGDSAGGGLTLATLLNIRDRGLPMPACAVTLSPGTNSVPDLAELQRRCPDDAMLSANLIRNVLDIYLPNPADRTHPYASPMRADLSGLAPLMMVLSKDELLYPDALRTRHRATQCGVSVEWLERAGVFHVWPVMVPFLPEAQRDFRAIVRFIKRHVPVPGAQSQGYSNPQVSLA